MGFYDTAKVRSERFVRMNDTEQQPPAGRLKVVKAEKRLSADKKEYPVLVLEDEDGNQVCASAWERDVAACLKQWGEVDPVDWGYVVFRKMERRFLLEPAADQNPRVEVMIV